MPVLVRTVATNSRTRERELEPGLVNEAPPRGSASYEVDLCAGEGPLLLEALIGAAQEIGARVVHATYARTLIVTLSGEVSQERILQQLSRALEDHGCRHALRASPA